MRYDGRFWWGRAIVVGASHQSGKGFGMEPVMVRDGFCFTAGEGEMVIRNRVGESPLRWLSGLMLFGVVLVVGVQFLIHIGHSIASDGLLPRGEASSGWGVVRAIVLLLVVLAVIVAVVLAWARPVFGGHEQMRLTAAEMTITNVDFGVAWRRRQFLPKEVSEVRYTEVASSDTSTIYGIQFRWRRGRVTVFRYIEEGVAGDMIEAMRQYGYR